MERGSRDRVTIELRGLRERLHTLAAARRLTAAALARKALVALLDDEPSDGDTSYSDTAMRSGGRIVKVTLRLSAAHAAALATRARAADVSQGTYVAGLIHGTPPGPLPPDHTHAVAALVGSTDQLAAMSTGRLPGQAAAGRRCRKTAKAQGVRACAARECAEPPAPPGSAA